MEFHHYRLTICPLLPLGYMPIRIKLISRGILFNLLDERNGGGSSPPIGVQVLTLHLRILQEAVSVGFRSNLHPVVKERCGYLLIVLHKNNLSGLAFLLRGRSSFFIPLIYFALEVSFIRWMRPRESTIFGIARKQALF